MNFDRIKYQLQSFYQNNKLLSYLILGDLVLIMVFGGSLFEAIFNAYLIYFGGTIFRYYLDEKRMINVLIGGGIIGGIITFIVFPNLSILLILKSVLTSASIALFVAAATYVPNMEVMLFFLGRVKLKWIAIAFVVLDILNINIHYSNAAIGDIGGIIFGFLLIYFGRNRSFVKTPNFLKWFMRPRGPYYKKTSKKKETSTKRAETDEEYNTRKNKEQAEIDAILEKIKQKGYESLSAAEKQKLFNKSNNG